MNSELHTQPKAAKQDRYTELLELGKDCQTNGDLSFAIDHFSEAINCDPKSAPAYLELAKCYHQIRNFPAERATFELYRRRLGLVEPGSAYKPIQVSSSQKQPERHRPESFNPNSFEHGKFLVVTTNSDFNYQERWTGETNYLWPLISETLSIQSSDCVIDYGCGVGRLAKPLIERFDCTVIGVDQNLSMLRYAREYVDSPKFITITPDTLSEFTRHGLRATKLYSTWVLQHAYNPELEIDRMNQALVPGAPVFIANAHDRMIPQHKQHGECSHLNANGTLYACL